MGTTLLETLIWWLGLFAIGLITLPVCVLVFSKLKDRGYLFAKVMGLIITSYLVFLMATTRLMTFRLFTILMMVGVLWIAECIWLLVSKKAAVHFGNVLKDRLFWKHAVLEEVVFALALFLWAYLRSRTPALNHTEMFMDHGFVKSILNADYLPSPDMWYAGSDINYYYYGQYVTAFLCKLTGTDSAVGYNLMMATLFAMTLVLSFSVVYQLLNMKQGMKTWMAAAGGILSALVTAISGNAHSFLYGIIFPFFTKLGFIHYIYPHAIDRYWYPDATRYIHCFEGSQDETITEFPLYSFVLSDLHAHVVNIMFVLLFLALLIVAVQSDHNNPWKRVGIAPVMLLCGFMLGIMGMTNYWDFAIYMVVFAFFAVYMAWKKYGSWKEPRLYLAALWQTACLYLLAKLVMLPFSLTFQKINVSLALVQDHSPVLEYLVLWGIPIVWVSVFLIYCIRRKQNVEEADIITIILCVCAIGLIASPEVLYIKDIYTSAPRCNTMFKFTYEAFILFGLVTGYIAVRILCREGISIRKRVISGILMLILLIPPFCYPYFAIHEVYFTGESAGTLDGLAYIQEQDAGEYAAIQWIDENTSADAIVLEANALSYSEGDRVSMATGRQTLQGWWTHQMLWRNLSAEELDVRIREIREIYEGTDTTQTEALIRKYGIDYIYIGKREREAYPQLQILKLQLLADHIYDFDGTLLLECR